VNDTTVHLVGLSHRTAPVALRERLAFRPADLPAALGRLLACGCRETVILSTCNRVEIYAVAGTGVANLPARMRSFLSEHHNLLEEIFTSALYQSSGEEAVRHLFEVAASLDSQILGETEILAQAKKAYQAAAGCGACGPLLHTLFERSFFLARQVRAEGGLGRAKTSLSSAAVALAKKVFELKGRKILVMGAGVMAAGIVRALHEAGAGEVFAAARTNERAEEFARASGATPRELRNVSEELPGVDLVLVSTAAPHYLLGPGQIHACAARRHGRPLVIIDISVPRNVDPAVAECTDTYLYDIDDLEEVAREGRAERELAASRWRPRLANEARELVCRLQASEADETARRLLAHAGAVRAEIMRQAKLASLGSQAAQEIERLLDRMQSRLLHGPLETLKQAAREGDGADASAWIARLFRLGRPESGAGAEAALPGTDKDAPE